MKKWLVILGCFGWGAGFSVQASVVQMMEGIENQENRGVYPAVTSTCGQGVPSERMAPALDEISSLQHRIKGAYASADAKALQEAYQTFIGLNLPEDIWAQYARVSKVVSWPTQTTVREWVGAHLFYPAHALEWFDCPYQSPLIERLDIVWGLAISAKLNHPFGKYLLAETIRRIRRHGNFQPLTDFFKQYFGEAIAELASLDHPDARYLLGRGQEEYPYPASAYNTGETLPKASTLFASDPRHARNQYYAYEEDNPDRTRTAEAYLAFARAGYPPAYLKAAEKTQSEVEEVAFLKEAYEKRYVPAALDLGYFYKRQKDFRLAASYFEKAAQQGFPLGYIELGELLVGDPTASRRTECTSETEEQAANYFHLAGEAKDPRGWSYLISLWENRFDFERQPKKEMPVNKEQVRIYSTKLAAAIVRGMQAGLPKAYLKAQAYFKQPYFIDLMRLYGYPPQGDIRWNWEEQDAEPVYVKSLSEVIEEFLKS